eukprot:14901854-Alexandrium_andersonii.AAC.1
MNTWDCPVAPAAPVCLPWSRAAQTCPELVVPTQKQPRAPGPPFQTPHPNLPSRPPTYHLPTPAAVLERGAAATCRPQTRRPSARLGAQSTGPVSYTHLTLPTICSV